MRGWSTKVPDPRTGSAVSGTDGVRHGFQSTSSWPRSSTRRDGSRDVVKLETAATRLDLLIEGLVVSLLAFMPLVLGVVAPWSEMVVVAVSLAIATCLTLKPLIYRNSEGNRFHWTWAYLPIALFFLLTALQLVPLPAFVVRAISPETLNLKARLLGEAQGRTALSFYPFAASRDLRVLLVATVLFAAVVNTFQRASQIKRLLTAVAVIGGAFALLALLQVVTGSERIYWFIPTYGKAQSGPFINPNHYAQFMNLSVGAAVALLIVHLREKLPRHLVPAEVLDRLQGTEFRAAWWVVGVVVVGAITVFLSLSRGGVVGMLAATVFTGVMLAFRRGIGVGGWGLALLGLLVFAALLYGGFDAVADRFASLHNGDPTAGRAQIYKDVAVSWQQFPLLGMGLGTWEVTYPMFDRSTIAKVAEYADADYAQALHEVGVVGLALVLLFAAVIWANHARATRSGRVPLCAAAFGLGMGLLAVMVQSATDYGQHMPAVAGLTAVTCGLLVCLGRAARSGASAEGQARAKQSQDGPKDMGLQQGPNKAIGRRPPYVFFPTAIGQVAIPLALLAGMAWAVVSVNTVRVAERHFEQAQSLGRLLEADGWQGSNAEYATLITDAAMASAQVPGNVEYRYWVNAYRWRSISRVTDEETGEVLMTDQAVGWVRRIVDELQASRRLCPTYGPLLSLAGQLELQVLDMPEQGAADVRLGRVLAPNEPVAVFAAALVDVAEEQWEASVEKFRHGLLLNPNAIKEVLAVYLGAGRPRLALAVADGNPMSLHWLMEMLKPPAGDAEKVHDAETVRDAETKFLGLAAAREYQDIAWILAEAARLYRDRGNLQAAVEYYQKAVARDYDQAGWRLQLARCLAEQGRTEEAMAQARLCLRIQPQFAAARILIEELSVRSTTDSPAGGAGATGKAAGGRPPR